MSGPYEKACKWTLVIAPTRQFLPGKVPQADLVKAYSQSDLYVVSSRMETANVSMLQAMACSVPVVTTSCGAPETLIDDSVGIAVKPNDPHALAEGILQVARNSQRYDGDALRRFVVERYSKSAVGKQVMEAYRVALGGKKIIDHHDIENLLKKASDNAGF